MGKTNAAAILHALQYYEAGGWEEIGQLYSRLQACRLGSLDPKRIDLERMAAQAMQQVNRIGPKQSRNFWQALGVTQAVIPLDSRVLGWGKTNLQFPHGLDSSLLAREEGYRIIEDGFHSICRMVPVSPCLFDAAVFRSFDADPPADSDIASKNSRVPKYGQSSWFLS